MKRLYLSIFKIWQAEKGRPVALVLLALFALLFSFPDLVLFKTVRLALFDQYQAISPRQSNSQSVIIVAIDEDSLSALGQWPWPRNYFAALIDAIAALKPAAVGLDIIMPEADHASPQAVAESRPDLPEEIRSSLLALVPNDRILAKSLAATPSILGVAGFKFSTSATLQGVRSTEILVHGDNPLKWLNSYQYVLVSLPEFQSAARGQALLSSDPENGIVRRAALLSDVNGQITPGLALEMLRVSRAAAGIVVDSGMHGVNSVTIGGQSIPLQENGEAWVHFDRFSERRTISAKSLLNNEISPDRIAGKMVLVGLTGLGLQDFITTPLGDRRHGVEVHAQLIESFEDGHFLTRPWWMHRVEWAVMVLGGLMLIWFVPNARPRAVTWPRAEGGAARGEIISPLHQERRTRDRTKGMSPKFVALLGFSLVFILLGAGMALFCWGGLLFDAASLLMVLGAIFVSLLGSVFAEASRLRKSAEAALQGQRVKAAQLAGELDAARRIQLGTLPHAATSFFGEHRFEIEAILEPARQVGGDLYDFFMIDERRLFFVIGDVSGKGLPASLFMVVTKALAKSAALRGIDGIGEIMTLTNTEMARENPEMLFVTAVSGILDVESGAIELVNAGHDAPLRIAAVGTVESINGDGGPPLCVLDDFVYPVVRLQLSAGDVLLLLTDGITEAMNSSKELYGMARVSRVLDQVAKNQPPAVIVSALREDVRLFVGDMEPSDDLTLLALRWMGGC